MRTIKTYSELSRLHTYKERLEYLQMGGLVGKDTFGFDRIFNQKFYKSKEWKKVRDFVICRDGGCDLGIADRVIFDKIIIHHMNPISLEDINQASEYLLDPEYLICVTMNTHNAIHYGDDISIAEEFAERKPNDTCPWKMR